MLSRVADSLYWMSRYLERAEHTARLLDVNLHQMLDQTPESANQRWERLLASLRIPSPKEGTNDVYSITRLLIFDAANSASIVACILAARENARQVREQLSSEMWEQLNRLFLQVKRTSMDESWRREPHEFFKSVKEGVHLLQGITDTTMSHDEGWQFIQIGRFLERANSTATLLDNHFNTIGQLDYLSWIGLLKSCTAFEAYCKVYTADIRPEYVAEFLLLDVTFPHSIHFSVDIMQNELKAISRRTNARDAFRAERLAGRLQAALDYGQVDEIMASNLHLFLENIRQQCAQIHTAIHEIFIAYPADSALDS